MDINISGQHVKITEPLHNYAKEKLEKLINRCGVPVTHAHIVLEADKLVQQTGDKLLQTAKATLHTPGKKEIYASDTTKDLYSAIDGLIDKLEQQLKKQHDRMKDHR